MKKDSLHRLSAGTKAGLRASKQPAWVAPMLPTLTKSTFSRDGWLFEEKYDGERCLVFRRDGNLNLSSRNRKRLNDKYPELVAALLAQGPNRFIADGEIVAFKSGANSFAMLQQRMQIKHPTPELIRKVPVRFHLFDLIYLDQYDLRRLPLEQRKRMLRGAFGWEDPLRFAEHRERDGEAYFKQACRRGWEGLIAKDGQSLYGSGRTREWLKFKCVQGQEFVIGGYTEPQGARAGFGALLVGYYRDGKLMYAGKVGTGYDTATLLMLSRKLKEIETAVCPFADDCEKRAAHWVKPKLVAQVGFSEWTRDGRLRHPRFLGLRDDKRPQEVVKEG
jgi:bifunctional non-homologous end joining protein LigD